MRTYRYAMKNTSDNLSWCKPVEISYHNHTAITIINERRLIYLAIGKKEVDKPSISDLAEFLGLDIDNINTLRDIFDTEGVSTTDLACASCPSFNDCDAMYEEYKF